MGTTNFFSRAIKLQVTQYLFNWTWFSVVNSAMVYFLKVLAFGVRICLWVKVFCPTLFFLKTHTKLENSIFIIHISTLLENSPSNKMHVYVCIYIYIKRIHFFVNWKLTQCRALLMYWLQIIRWLVSSTVGTCGNGCWQLLLIARC